MNQAVKYKQTEVGKIPKDWGLEKLEILSKFLYGLGESAEDKGEYVYIRITDISDDNTLKANEVKYLDSKKVKKKCILRKGDVLVARTGATYGKTVLFNKDFKATYGGFLIKLMFNESLLDNKFFFQFSRSRLYWQQANNLVGGGAQPQFNANTISELKVPLPKIKEQKAIAKILSDFDSKIELLQKQNETLEKMGQAIFKHWFVDFEFPNEEGQPYNSSGGEMVDSELGEIPKGWEVGILKDFVIPIKDSIDPSTNPNQDFVHYSIPAYDNGKVPEIEKGCFIKSNKHKVDSNNILFSKLNPRFPRIWTISNLIKPFSICSTEFIVLQPKSDLNFGYLHFFLIHPTNLKKIQSYTKGTSSSHQRISPDDLLGLSVIMPEQFCYKIKSSIFPLLNNLTFQMEDNIMQTVSLRQLRDSLLPKLMTGKIRVKV